jgi:hypothetical protein
MPTLEQLFKNRQLPSQGGQTAEEAYDIRDANKIQLSSSSPVINGTTMKLVNKLRSGNNSPLSETVLEQEVTGIRVLGTLSQPLLYGAELGRLVTRTTAPLGEMKLDTSGLLPSGPIGKVFKSVRTFATKTLGIPTLVTPTFTKNFSDPIKGSLEKTNNIQKDYQKVLTDIKDSSNGSLLGRLLKGGLGSLTDPNQLKAKVIGEALKFGKGLLRKKLIGGGGNPSENNFDFKTNGDYEKGVKVVRNYGPKKDNLSFSASGLLSKASSLGKSSGNYFDADGATYSSFFKPTVNTQINKNAGEVGLFGAKIPFATFTVQTKANEVEENVDFGLAKQSPFPTLDVKNLDDTGGKKEGTISSPNRRAKISAKEKDDRIKEIKNLDTITNARYNNSSFGIALNKKGIYDIKEEDTSVDDLDSIVLKFESVKQNKAVNFVSTITGLGESFSPGWSSNKFIGNPFNFYTYEGIERSVSFSFKIFSLNPSEHKIAWDKLNFLTSLVYPQAYEGEAGYITAPFLKLTIGDMYRRKEGFIESLSYGIDDSTPWNTEDTYESVEGDINTKGYRLPRIINVETTFKFIETRNNTEKGKYPFAEDLFDSITAIGSALT